jgi:hypothetical protein
MRKGFIMYAMKVMGVMLLFALIGGISCAVYSSMWQKPRAEKASLEFSRGVVLGMSEGEVRALATQLQASYVSNSEAHSSDSNVYVRFNTFPGGAARYFCSVHFTNGRAERAKCNFSG